MSAPTTQLESTTALVKFEAKLHRLWIAHQSVTSPSSERRKLKPLPKLAKQDTITCGTSIASTEGNDEVAAYLKRIGVA